MVISLINENEIITKLKSKENPFFSDYYAFYSSWFNGIVTDPALMLLPIDDHMVHRGDGVFEALKSVDRRVYLLDEHLQRLKNSADKIALDFPCSLAEIKEIVLATLRVANQADTMIRIYLSRGPGNFSANPYDTVGAQLYVVVSKLTPPSPASYNHGVTIGKSDIPVKLSWLAQIKSCNYLPNVLMKKESVDRQLEFTIGVDSQGHVTESATENVMIVDQEDTLAHPALDYILKGTMMTRASQLAQQVGIKAQARAITLQELHMAKEVMITGTSLNILPVIRCDQTQISNGKPGPIAKKLNELMLQDIKQGVVF